MENLTGGTPPVRYLPCVVPCKLYFAVDEIENILMWEAIRNHISLRACETEYGDSLSCDYHAIIHRALKYAVKTDLIAVNPADKVDRPRKNEFTGSF